MLIFNWQQRFCYKKIKNLNHFLEIPLTQLATKVFVQWKLISVLENEKKKITLKCKYMDHLSRHYYKLSQYSIKSIICRCFINGYNYSFFQINPWWHYHLSRCLLSTKYLPLGLLKTRLLKQEMPHNQELILIVNLITIN